MRNQISKFEMPQMTFELAAACSRLVCQISDKYERQDCLPPLVGLNMAYNSLVQCFEVLDFYYDRWSKLEISYKKSKTRHKQILSENEDRVTYFQKTTLIMILSSFEEAAKNALNLSGFVSLELKDRIYLSKILQASNKIGLTTDSDYELWNFALEFRNSLVHNNAVAEKDIKYDLGDGLILQMKNGLMIQSSPRKTLLLTRQVIECYARWCDATLAKSFNMAANSTPSGLP